MIKKIKNENIKKNKIEENSKSNTNYLTQDDFKILNNIFNYA